MVAGSGLAALVAMTVAGALDVPGLTISFSPLAFPSIPLLPVVGILIALAPAVVAPNPIASSTTQASGGAETREPRPRTASRRDPVQPDLSGVST
jgi:energy-coupling factor transport system permease protein